MHTQVIIVETKPSFEKKTNNIQYPLISLSLLSLGLTEKMFQQSKTIHE